jgi:hypothetical protein
MDWLATVIAKVRLALEGVAVPALVQRHHAAVEMKLRREFPGLTPRELTIGRRYAEELLRHII